MIAAPGADHLLKGPADVLKEGPTDVSVSAGQQSVLWCRMLLLQAAQLWQELYNAFAAYLAATVVLSGCSCMTSFFEEDQGGGGGPGLVCMQTLLPQIVQLLLQLRLSCTKPLLGSCMTATCFCV